MWTRSGTRRSHQQSLDISRGRFDNGPDGVEDRQNDELYPAKHVSDSGSGWLCGRRDHGTNEIDRGEQRVILV